jgi:hypothetical protein
VITNVLAATLICVSTIIVAYAIWRARRRGEASAGASAIGSALRFVSGPFPLSISLHAFLLLFLIITMHESRHRDLIMVNLEAGGGGGSAEEMRDLDMQVEAMPEIERTSFPEPTAADANSATVAAIDYVRGVSSGGIGVGRGGGIGNGTGPGIGPGWSGFIGDLRRKGLDVVLVIDGTGSMSLVIQDVKSRMRELVAAIHRLVPTARVGIVVYGGKGDPIQTQQLTLSSAKLETFLASIGAAGGDEWEENVRGGIEAATEHMDWRPYAKKVIVIVGDTPPSKEDFASTRQMVRDFHAHNGTFNAVDLAMLEHRRFDDALEKQVHRDMSQKEANNALPAFQRETQLAYQVLVRDGGGAIHSLDSNEQISQQVMVLAFGEQWRNMIAAFDRPLASK